MKPELGAMIRVLAGHGARADIKSKHGLTAAAMAADGLTAVKALFLESFPATTGPKLVDGAGNPPALHRQTAAARTTAQP
jgi:hypothetical protein